MAKKCTTEKTSQRQRWIEQGLLELMLEVGYEQVTVTELCQRLGLSRRSFYRYFRDIDDVLDALMEHTFQDFAAPDRMLELGELQESFAFWLGQKPLLDALFRSGMSGKLAEYALRFTKAEVLKSYMLPDDTGMDLSRETNLFVICGLTALVIAWHAEGFQKTPEQMAQIARRMLYSPILLER